MFTNVRSTVGLAATFIMCVALDLSILPSLTHCLVDISHSCHFDLSNTGVPDTSNNNAAVPGPW